MTKSVRHSIVLLCALVLTAGQGFAQLNKITFDLYKEKPKEFKNRELRSEKTGNKKFTLPRKFIQNTTSHYNFYFNANNKINSVIEMARIAEVNDYSHMLPYYSYSLENTSAMASDLDSVVQKATAGILLHDLRSNWVDNFYMLIGKSYFLQKKFDSAYMAFQFINFNLHPKDKKNKKRDEQIVVGSNLNKNKPAGSIASKEDRKFFDRILSQPPSRNDALVWQALTLTYMEKYGEAAGLMHTLKNDPQFPERLQSLLAEVEGYWFYSRGQYDSTIHYLEQSLPNSIDQQDKAHKEFLLAQLYEQKKSVDTSAYYYSLAIRHTTDPLMDIYGNLNKAMLLKSDDPQEIMNTVGTLLRMAKKDKYENYRDIIFFAAGELAMEIPDTASAIAFFKRSAHFNTENLSLKNKAFLNLAQLSYDQRDYRNSFNFYDSLQNGDTAITAEMWNKINNTKSSLAEVVKELNVIEREDSLQEVASLPTAEREALLKKLSRKLKKERGIQDYDSDYDSPSGVFDTKNNNTPLFSQDDQKGDWYFYNTSAKSKGYSEFRSVWGRRQNIDNWRRIPGSLSTVAQVPNARPIDPNAGLAGDDPMVAPPPGNKMIDILVPIQDDISVDGLRANLPLTQPLLDSSNGRIALALFALGKHYQNLLEDYREAINTYETSLAKFPDSLYGGELYMNLSYCYKQLGNTAMSERYKSMLLQKFASSEYADRIQNPKKYAPVEKDPVTTKVYDAIYTKFIEGNFEDAVREKRVADSIYGKTYWSPQLLYIESVYYIKDRQDSMATVTLKEIVKEFPESPMKEKAQNIIRVLSYRDSLENYLTKLQVERLKEDSQIVVFDDTRIKGNIGTQKLERDDSKLIPIKVTTVDVPKLNEEKKAPVVIKNQAFAIDPLSDQNVVMILTKVDPVYSSEARTAFNRYNQVKYYSRKIDIVKDTLDDDRTLLVFSGFVSAEDAIRYIERIRKDAPGEISWLPADKYFFTMISDGNLALLKENKKLDSYLELLKQKFPDKF